MKQIGLCFIPVGLCSVVVGGVQVFGAHAVIFVVTLGKTYADATGRAVAIAKKHDSGCLQRQLQGMKRRWIDIGLFFRFRLKNQESGNAALRRKLIDGDTEKRSCGADLCGCSHRINMVKSRPKSIGSKEGSAQDFAVNRKRLVDHGFKAEGMAADGGIVGEAGAYRVVRKPFHGARE